MTAVHPIEAESYRILRERVDLSHLDAGAAAVIARIVHASADLEYVATTVVGCDAVSRGVAALRAGAPVITDVEMTRAGITGAATRCFLDRVREGAPTRTAAAIRLAAGQHPEGAIFVIGCAPTALAELLTLDVRPALVIGLPVGFVGAAEAKQALRDSHLAAVAITNIGEKGGSAVAAAACNAIGRLARD
jgi:precorrin-8X/cobalt-precorrin-8 methylmutase